MSGMPVFATERMVRHKGQQPPAGPSGRLQPLALRFTMGNRAAYAACMPRCLLQCVTRGALEFCAVQLDRYM
jgi:hypothetical protein